jgi:hypothetical protein
MINDPGKHTVKSADPRIRKCIPYRRGAGTAMPLAAISAVTAALKVWADHLAEGHNDRVVPALPTSSQRIWS